MQGTMIKGDDNILNNPIHNQIWNGIINQSVIDCFSNDLDREEWRKLTVKRFDNADRISRSAGGRGFLDC